MTEAARRVLADCRDALCELEGSSDQAMWRRRWVTCVSLLRAVGHVLYRVDGPSSRALASIIRSRFEQLKVAHPEIWEFIEDERNSVLKEYAIGPQLIASGSGTSLSVSAKFGMITTKPGVSREMLIHVVEGGPFDGRRETEVVAEAIALWQNHLDSIDEDLLHQA